MIALWIAVGVIVAIALLSHFKTSRADGILVKRVHPYRRLMWFIMPTRNESVVYYDDYINAEPLLAYLEEAKKQFNVDITHALVAAVNVGLKECPTMNHFIVGRRMYLRKHRAITFSMKREAMNKKAKIAVVKLEMDDNENFRELCERMGGSIHKQRSGKKTHADKEYALFNALPRTVLWSLTGLFKVFDYLNILPYKAFIKTDGLYTSCVVANLGSLGMNAAYHHLYEWGNCSLFMMAGRIEERPVVVDGQVVARKTLHVRWSFDERIDDGLSSSYGMAAVRRVLETPRKSLGCLAADGSDHQPLCDASRD
jgi:hypothetical protein